MRPNIVFIFPDQFRYAAQGWVKEDPVITPNIDRLAGQSLAVTNMISNQPLCSPYRGMLFTGRYSFNSGVPDNCNSLREWELSAETRCLSDVLHDAGYHQAYIGKLHLDKPRPPYEWTEGPRRSGVVWDAYTPPGDRRHHFDFWYSYGCCDRHLRPHYWTGPGPVESRIDVQEWSVRHETDVAIDYLRNGRDKTKPFMLMVSHNPPHPPFEEVPEEYVDRYAGATARELLVRPNVRPDDPRPQRAVKQYFAAVTGVDEQLGRILACLEEEGLAENTIFVFTSDHGEMMGSHGLMNKNVIYDESLRVPFLIRWPGKIKPGVDDVLLSVPDLMPTLLGLAGLGDRIPPRVEGEDRSGVLLGTGGERPAAALFLFPELEKPGGGARGVRTHRFAYEACLRDGAIKRRLFDMKQDPYQMRDVADQHPDVVADLHDWMIRQLHRIGDPRCNAFT